MKNILLAALHKSKSKKGTDSEKAEKGEDVKNKKTKLNQDEKLKKDVEKGNDVHNAKELEKSRASNFPCCFYIPLDIAMEGFALLDIIYYTCFALIWAIILTIEPFAGKDEQILLDNLHNNTNRNHIQQSIINGRLLDLQDAALNKLLARSRSRSQTSLDADEQLDFNDFKETSTTFGPIEYHAVDQMNEARVYSRIARRFQMFGQEVDDGCGRNYYLEFLYANSLDTTRDLFEEVARNTITASLLYAAIGCILLSTICCFRGYIASKVLVIFLWYMQLVPSYIILRAAVISQSQRFCILQYGIGKSTRGQRFILWSLLWPLITYKPYEAFIWANYIRRYFKNKEGKLLDESYFSTGKLDERQHKLFSMNPFNMKEDYQHHMRAKERSKLFRHTQQRDIDFDKRDVEKHDDNDSLKYKKRSSSSN